jgi:hypothetical protein
MASRAFWSFALLVLGAAALVIYVAIEGIPS